MHREIIELNISADMLMSQAKPRYLILIIYLSHIVVIFHYPGL